MPAELTRGSGLEVELAIGEGARAIGLSPRLIEFDRNGMAICDSLERHLIANLQSENAIACVRL